MSGDDKKYPPRPDGDLDVRIPPRWLELRNTLPWNGAGEKSRIDVPVADSPGVAPRLRRRPLLLLQDDDYVPDVLPPTMPPETLAAAPSSWRPAGAAAASAESSSNAAGSSVAPVAMDPGDHVQRGFERRQVVHGAAYAVILGVVCLGAVGFYRGGGFERSTLAIGLDRVWATAPVQRVLAAAPIEALSAARTAPREIEAAPFDLAKVDAALDGAWHRAKTCIPPEDKGLPVTVNVVLSPSGRITSAWVAGNRYGGTTVGHCIARTFRSTVTAAFQGEALVVDRTYTVP
jgi:hypothetical protein